MWEPQGVDFHQNWRLNPMQSKLYMHRSPRCGAQTRSRSACQAPVMPNGRCRLHGGLSTGAPRGNKNAFKHGRYTADALRLRRDLSVLARAMKALSREAE